MSILEDEPGLLDALRGAMTPKFLATRSPDDESGSGAPNVVPCISLLPADDQPDTLFFGNFLLRKSIKNLERDQRLAVLVITESLDGWVLKGDFVEFQRTGAYVDRQMGSDLLRYNAYTGIRNAGVLRVRSLEWSFRISKLQAARDFALARLASLSGNIRKISEHPTASAATTVPLPTRREFARMAAVKVLSWIDEDGYPIVVPALSLQPAGEHGLVGWLDMRGMPTPPPGVLAAANILTFEAISYQAKGRWFPSGGGGVLQVQEVFAGGPPHPGGRVA
ncbi:MAG: pyridoxamine 5'-phosphate oxidase family protein [Anaerolineales bacterium]|nr:pyridoxamine 5'-phosphate oxidase family protein [Anaerolineales bacterium]